MVVENNEFKEEENLIAFFRDGNEHAGLSIFM